MACSNHAFSIKKKPVYLRIIDYFLSFLRHTQEAFYCVLPVNRRRDKASELDDKDFS
jgi:hypothetical protein